MAHIVLIRTFGSLDKILDCACLGNVDIERSCAEVSDLESTVQMLGTPTCCRAPQLGSAEKVNLYMLL